PSSNAVPEPNSVPTRRPSDLPWRIAYDGRARGGNDAELQRVREHAARIVTGHEIDGAGNGHGGIAHLEHPAIGDLLLELPDLDADRKSTRLNSSHVKISYAVF